MAKKKNHWKVVIAGIAAVTIIEVVALSKGIDGTLMMIVIGAICAAIGIQIPTPKYMK